jgi:hypothetical protein
MMATPCGAQSVVDPALQVQTLTSGLSAPTTMSCVELRNTMLVGPTVSSVGMEKGLARCA